MKGILSVSVPGLLNAWLDTHEAHGRLPLSDVLAPAIALASDGFPLRITWRQPSPATGCFASFPPAGRFTPEMARGSPCRPATS